MQIKILLRRKYMTKSVFPFSYLHFSKVKKDTLEHMAVWREKYRKGRNTSGVNFIKMCMCSFYTRRFQKRKKLLNLTVFWALLRSAHVKAARKMLVRLTPEGKRRKNLKGLTENVPHVHQKKESHFNCLCTNKATQ